MASGVLLDAFKLKPAAAIAYLKAKGNAYSQNWYDTWQDAHARSFVVAKAVQADVLQSIREEVTRALEDGRTLAQFKKDLTPRLKALGWWGKQTDKDGKEVQLGSPYRLRTIYRTNIQSAYQAGHYKQAMEVSQRRPWWRYEAILDAKTRPAHKALHGKVFRYDDPVWDHIMPPNGFGCRCGFSTRSDRELARDGITPESSEGKIVEREVVIRGNDGEPVPATIHGIKTTTRDGQPITMWTDPGWDYNPGKAAYHPNLERYDPKVAQQYLSGVVTGPDFTRFFEAKGAISGEYPVAVLDNEYAKLIGASSRTVRLSSESLLKNVEHHPELSLKEYQLIPWVITDAELIIQVGELKQIFVRKAGYIYQAVVKSTKPGDKLYLVSYHRANERTIIQARKYGKILRDKM